MSKTQKTEPKEEIGEEENIPSGYRLREPRSAYSRGLGPTYYKNEGVAPEGVAPENGVEGTQGAPEGGAPEGGAHWQGFRVEARHLNGAGVVHGGMISTLADNIMAGALFLALRGRGLTIQMNLQFMSAAHNGDWLEGRGRVLNMTKRFVFCEAELFVGDRLIAKTSGVFKRPQAS